MFEGLKRTLNIGGASLVLTTDSPAYAQGDPISGEFLVVASERGESGNSIKLELKEFWVEERGSGRSRRRVTVYKTREEVHLTQAFSLVPGAEYTFPFKVRLPLGCRVSTHETGWCLIVTMDIPRAVDPTARITLDVGPAREFLAIIEACQKEMAFVERSGHRRWNQRTSKTHFHLEAPHDMKDSIDHIAFDLQQAEDGMVRGEIIIDRQEHSFSDRLKAAVGKDKVKRPFQLTGAELFRDGNPKSSAIAGRIRQTIEEALLQAKP